MVALAGHIAEIWAANGSKYEQLIQKYIFSPLGMTSAAFIHLITDYSTQAMPGLYDSGSKKWTAFDTRAFQYASHIPTCQTIAIERIICPLQFV